MIERRNMALYFLDGMAARQRLLFALAYFTSLPVGCDRLSPPGDNPSASERKELDAGLKPTASTIPPHGSTESPKTSPNPPTASDAGIAPSASEHHGPWLNVLSSGAAIYASPKGDKDAKLGYAQSGARLAIKDKPKSGENCQSGWAELVARGFICSNAGTLDEKDARTKSTVRAPNLDALLPYTYARNTKNGTPMYKSVPSREEMRRYEPYLAEEKAAKESKPPTASTEVAPAAPSAGASSSAPPPPPGASAQASASAAPASSSSAPPEEDESTPWWQKQNIQDK